MGNRLVARAMLEQQNQPVHRRTEARRRISSRPAAEMTEHGFLSYLDALERERSTYLALTQLGHVAGPGDEWVPISGVRFESAQPVATDDGGCFVAPGGDLLR